MEIKRSFWYSALNLCRILSMCLLSGRRNDAQSTSNTFSILLRSPISHYQYFLRTAFHAVHLKQISHRHPEAIKPPIRLCPHAYARTIVHRTQTHTHVRCSSVRRRASATGRPCMALYPPPNMFTFVGPLLNASSSPANMTPDLGTYAHTETVYAYLSMRTCAENASRPL